MSRVKLEFPLLNKKYTFPPSYWLESLSHPESSAKRHQRTRETTTNKIKLKTQGNEEQRHMTGVWDPPPWLTTTPN